MTTKSKYAELIAKRLEATPGEGELETVELCIDPAGYTASRGAWHQARGEAERLRLQLAKPADAPAGKRRMNSGKSAQEMEQALESAEAAERDARDAVRENFVVLHFRSLDAAESQAILLEAKGDTRAWNRLVIERALVKVTAHDGDVIGDVTPEMVATLVAKSPAGEANKIMKAADKASAAVDFPM